jgi:hypothetical protein
MARLGSLLYGTDQQPRALTGRIALICGTIVLAAGLALSTTVEPPEFARRPPDNGRAQ